MAWTDESKQQAISMYLERKPTPANSMEIVKEIAEELDESPNGVRLILTKAEVYIKKEAGAAASKTATGATAEKAKRVSKADANEALTSALKDAGVDADDEIISKLTGKAALYFAGVIAQLTK